MQNEDKDRTRFRETYELNHERFEHKDAYYVTLVRTWWEEGKPMQQEYGVVEWKPKLMMRSDPGGGVAFEIPRYAEFQVGDEVLIGREKDENGKDIY